MFKSLCFLFLFAGNAAALKMAADPETVKFTKVQVPQEDGPGFESTRDDLLDLMMESGMPDELAKHKGKLEQAAKDAIWKDLEDGLRQSQESKMFTEVKQTASGTYGLVWVHGMGFTDWEPLMNKYLHIPQKDAKLSMAFPQSPKGLIRHTGQQGRTWYDMSVYPTPMMTTAFPPLLGCNHEQARKNVHIVQEAIDNLIESGIPSENIVIAGHSQGAYMALRAALTYPKKLGGIFFSAGFVIEPDTLGFEVYQKPVNKDTPIEWIHGKHDDVIVDGLQDIQVPKLKSLGLDVTLTKYNAGHTPTAVMYDHLSAFMNKVMTK